MKVSVTIPTRGDVDLQPIIDSFPPGWEIVIWDNGENRVYRSDGYAEYAPDLAVYGRYAAIAHCSHDLIVTQDDDVIVSDPQAIAKAWILECSRLAHIGIWDGVVCNTPQEFRPHYPDSGLVGFGAAFHRYAPAAAFGKFFEKSGWLSRFMAGGIDLKDEETARFLRRADNVFTTLTPRVLVDIPKTDCVYASDSNRMWRQPSHTSERDRMIELARQVRDA